MQLFGNTSVNLREYSHFLYYMQILLLELDVMRVKKWSHFLQAHFVTVDKPEPLQYVIPKWYFHLPSLKM